MKKIETMGEMLGAETIAVHDGQFHADDVVCVALLKAFGWKGRVIRTRDPEILKSVIGIDVAGSLTGDQFDHHGTAAVFGISALTKLLGFIGSEVSRTDSDVDPVMREAFTDMLGLYGADFAAIAAIDSGAVKDPSVYRTAFSWIGRAQAPAGSTKAQEDLAFDKAVDIARSLLCNLSGYAEGPRLYGKWMEFLAEVSGAIRRVKEGDAYEKTAAELNRIQDLYNDSNFDLGVYKVVTDALQAAAVWAATLKEAQAALTWDGTPPVLDVERPGMKEALHTLGCDAPFFVSPHGDEWAVIQTCPKDKPFNAFGSSRALPKEWGGLRGAELVKVSGYKSAIFAFAPGGGATVMAFFGDRSDAIAAAEEACK